MAEPITPLVNALNEPFWTAAAEGRLVLPLCVRTNRFFWPPASVSPFAGGTDVAWREAAPDGVLVARVVYRRVFQQALHGTMPYAVGLVALETGPRLLAHLPHPDDEGAATAGDRVRLVFRSIVDGGPKVLHAEPAGPRSTAPAPPAVMR